MGPVANSAPSRHNIPMSRRKLILIRHAHRDKDLGQHADNGLSRKGRKQAIAVREYFEKKFKSDSIFVISSPKKRCKETVKPIAKSLEAPFRVFKLLDEQRVRPPEPNGRFQGRIRRFLKIWEDNGGIWIACSHGDWIPECLQLLGLPKKNIPKASWITLSQKKKEWKVEEGSI